METPTTAYPLSWPLGRPRTPSHRRSVARFDTTFAVARDEILRELKRLGASRVILSTNVELRQDGIPYANRRQPDDQGVAVYFTYKGRSVCFACDKWNKIEDNMRAVCKTIEAIRGIARWGTGDMVDAAFSGFAALPPAAPSNNPAPRHWSAVLNVHSSASTLDVQAAYRLKAMTHHPDRGGNPKQMAEVNEAYQQFKRERGLS